MIIRKEEFRMLRMVTNSQYKYQEFLLCSFKHELCLALSCPDKTVKRDLIHRLR